MGHKTQPIRHGDAREVLDALGSEARLRGIVGAWKLRAAPGGLLFNLPREGWCFIALTAPDTFRIEIGHRDRPDVIEGVTHDVPRDKLAATFSAMTGIPLTL